MKTPGRRDGWPVELFGHWFLKICLSAEKDPRPLLIAREGKCEMFLLTAPLSSTSDEVSKGDSDLTIIASNMSQNSFLGKLS